MFRLAACLPQFSFKKNCGNSECPSQKCHALHGLFIWLTALFLWQLARAEWGARVKKYLCIRLHHGHTGKDMRFLGWYLKIAVGGAAIGASMELFMIHTGFCVSLLQPQLKKVIFSLVFIALCQCQSLFFYLVLLYRWEGNCVGIRKKSLGEQPRGSSHERSSESMEEAWWTREMIVLGSWPPSIVALHEVISILGIFAVGQTVIVPLSNCWMVGGSFYKCFRRIYPYVLIYIFWFNTHTQMACHLYVMHWCFILDNKEIIGLERLNSSIFNVLLLSFFICLLLLDYGFLWLKIADVARLRLCS